MLKKIVSGGQTGADRAALDAALASGFDCGGWCPEGRLAEDGTLPAIYPLAELAGGGYRQRTIRNIEDSDGTAIFYAVRPTGGTELTLAKCIQRSKPYQLVDIAAIDAERAAQMLVEFVEHEAIEVLNVAGPRESSLPGIHAYVRGAIGTLIGAVRSQAPT